MTRDKALLNLEIKAVKYVDCIGKVDLEEPRKRLAEAACEYANA